jgi:hypothetical protein
MVRLNRENTGVKKTPSTQRLADNLDRLMAKSVNLRSNAAVGRAAKPPIAHSHIRRIRLQESSCTLDILDQIAEVFGVQPWDLLTDTEETRRLVLERMLYNPNVAIPDTEVEKHIPTPDKSNGKRRRT